jgi:hypothetical protein
VKRAKFYRMFHRIFDDAMAQRFYLIPCHRTHRAVEAAKTL